jgi:hypothetical protein
MKTTSTTFITTIALMLFFAMGASYAHAEEEPTFLQLRERQVQNRQEFHDRIVERREDFQEQRQNLLETLIENRFNRAIVRLTNGAESIKIHIKEFRERDIDTNTAENHLETAYASLESAETSLETARTQAAAFLISAEISNEEEESFRTSLETARAHIFEAHESLKQAIDALREQQEALTNNSKNNEA